MVLRFRLLSVLFRDLSRTKRNPSERRRTALTWWMGRLVISGRVYMIARTFYQNFSYLALMALVSVSAEQDMRAPFDRGGEGGLDR